MLLHALEGIDMKYINASALTADMLKRQPIGIPIIMCSSAPRVMRKLKEVEYTELSLNKDLAAAMLKYQQEERNAHVVSEFQCIINSTKQPILLVDYEMLFDPRYKLDVLKVFCEAAKLTRIAVKWCGTIVDDKLEYSEPQYPDYHIFDLSQYTVICVK